MVAEQASVICTALDELPDDLDPSVLEQATKALVTFAEVHATLYHNMGLLKGQERVFDLRGRPQDPINRSAQPMRELI